MLWGAFVSIGTALAGLPAGLPPLPPDVEASVSSSDSRHMIELRTHGARATVRIEAARPDETSSPRCRAGGLALEVVAAEPRGAEVFDAWLEVACRELSNVAAPGGWSPGDLLRALGIFEAKGGWAVAGPVVHDATHELRVRSPWFLRPFHMLGLGLMMAWAGHAGLRRAVLGWTLAAALLRLATTGPTIFMGEGYPFERLIRGTGTLLLDHEIYSGTYATLFGIGWLTFNGDPHYAAYTNLFFSALTVGLLWSLVQQVAGTRTAHGVAALLALHPLAIALSQTPSMFVLAGLLQVSALLGVVQRNRAGDALAVVSTALLVHLRPFQLFFPPVVLLGLLWHRRHLAAAAVVGIVAHRGWALYALVAQSTEPIDAVSRRRLLDLLVPRHFFGEGGALVATDPWVQPAMLGVLAVVGLARAHGKRPIAGWAFIAFFFATLPYLHFHRATDLLRFHLPATTWLCALAGIGWMSLAPKTRAWAVLPLAASWAVASTPVGPLLWQEEQAALTTMHQHFSPAQTVHYAQGWDENGHFAEWVGMHGMGRWVPLGTTTPRDGDLYWQGRANAWPDAPSAPCSPTPLAVTTIDGATHGIEPAPTGPIDVGVFRLSDCPP